MVNGNGKHGFAAGRGFVSFVCLLLSLLYLAAMLSFFPPIMQWDEYGLTLLASGKLDGSPSYYIPFYNICYGRMLAAFSMCIPGINWTTVFSLLIVAFCFWAVLRCTAFRLLDGNHNGFSLWLPLFSTLVLLHSLFFCCIFDLRFTYSAAIAAVSFLYCFGKVVYVGWERPDHLARGWQSQLGDHCILLVLFLIPLVVRLPILYMSIPFVGLLLFLCLKGQKFSSIARQVLLAVMVMGAFSWIHSSAWSGERAGERMINSLRGRIQDYGKLPKYAEHEQMYREQGITRSEYKTIRRHFWGIAEHCTIDSLAAILKAKDQEKQTNCLDAIRHVFDGQRDIAPGILVALALLAVANIVLAVWNRNVWLGVSTAGSLLVWLAECFHLQLNGRTPFHVEYPLDLALLASLLVLFELNICQAKECRRDHQHESRNGRRKATDVAWFLGIALLAWNTTGHGLQQYSELSRKTNAFRQLLQYAKSRPEMLFICILNPMDWYHLDNQMAGNVIKLAGWIGITPEWRNRVNGGKCCPIEALTEREDIRFVAQDDQAIKVLEEYFNEQTAKEGQSILFVRDDFIQDDHGQYKYTVWKTERNGNTSIP